MIPHNHTVVQHGNGLLLLHIKPVLAKLMGQSVLVHLLEKPTPQYIRDPECSPDDSLGNLIQFFICVHLCPICG